jgi:phenylalanyl-tRNA synthetase beta chain
LNSARSESGAASGQSAAIYLKGERVGFIGVVHPELERKLDLNGRTLVFELEWNKLADRVVPQARRFPLPGEPSRHRGRGRGKRGCSRCFSRM